MLVFAGFVIFIAAAASATLVCITTSGAKREKNQDFKSKTREMTETALDLSLNALRQATDYCDNDGDGTVDEGMDQPNIFDPSVVITIEGNLGRLGTEKWGASNDTNGNGLPDFGEVNVTPINMSGGEVITYSIFSENDGQDNDLDGTVDELDEAGSILLVAQGRFDHYHSTVRYSGFFEDHWYPPPPPTWTPNEAFVCGGDLTVLGNCNVSGSQGNIHSNGFLDLGGSSLISGDATASNGGNIDPANVGGTVNTAVDPLLVPDVSFSNVQALCSQAIDDGKDVYFLKSNGDIVKDDKVLANGGPYHGWSQQATGEWTLNGSKVDLDGLFYASTDVFIQGGKQAVNMTVVSEGNIGINGNGNYTAYYDSFFLISLKDILLSGTPQESGDLGAIMAREQIKAEGTTFIRGPVFAADLDCASDFVTSNEISGTFDIEYNGGFTTSFPVFDPSDIQYDFDPTFSAYEER
jgi:hypothetical protein